MWRLLIVDDEPYIVDGLVDLFSDMSDLELEVYKAYSGVQALVWMNRTRIDIVLSDVRMPQMSGLELQQAIREQWPRCKVIFLTGYGEFDYIQTALRSGSVDYVLKTEYDEAVVKAVTHAVEALKRDMLSDQFMRQAQERLHMALPALQKEYLLAFLEGDIAGCKMKRERFRELGIGLELGTPYYLAIGQVDRWYVSERELSYSDRTLLLFAVQNIAEEYFRASAPLIQHILIDHRSFLWFIRCDRPGQFVVGVLETIQNTCRELLKLPVSFATSGMAASWHEMPAVYDRLKKLLRRGLGHGQEMLLTDTATAVPPAEARHDEKQHEARKQLKKISLLEMYLENGQQEEFNKQFTGLLEMFQADPSHPALLEMYYTTATMLISYINRWEPETEFGFSLLHAHSQTELLDAMHKLQEAANTLFAHKKRDLDARTTGVVEQINQYIAANLDGDLSLTRLAEIVYLNPSYLSRLYKHNSGIGLAEHINDAKLHKCRELLRQPHLKIHEIGKAVGFESPPYFTRFIKKMTNMTPQEFRDSLNK